MARTADMFQALKPPRALPTIRMHAVDHGYDGDLVLGLMKCNRCGHDGSWWNFANATELKRGAPCPMCNDTTRHPENEGERDG